MKVPLARRQLLARRGSTLAGVAGIAVALLLILALNGIVAGMESRITAVLDRSGPDVVVAQAGVDTIHMSESTLARSSADAVAAVPGVARVRPVSLVTTAVERGDARGMVYLVGEEQPGSTIAPVAGRAPGRDEIAIDRTLADELGVGIGSTVRTLGMPLRVSGELEKTASHTNSVAIVPRAEITGMLGGADVVNYVFVDADRGVGAGALSDRINAAVPGIKASSRASFARSERRLVGDMSTDIVRGMTFVGFVIGVSVAALVAYSLTLAQLRDYAVLRALGLRVRRALTLVLTQVGATVALGFGVALALVWALGALLAMHGDAMQLTLRFADVAEAIVVAGIVAALAAAFPVMRVAHIDPASVFRR
ncbi:MAG: ABC transporter permease [Solirubrobacterales bacterium]|nr:ABC transporter permease [Solirubrobacterales bacterium]